MSVDRYTPHWKLGIPAGDPDYTNQAERNREFHRKRLAGAPNREELLAERVSRYRERLLQIELSAGANASYEERAGNWELAALHRKYANYCKTVRMNHPLPENLQKGTKK